VHFHPDTGPLTDKNAPKPEREALSFLFAGAIGSYKTLRAIDAWRLTPMKQLKYNACQSLVANRGITQIAHAVIMPVISLLSDAGDFA